MPVADLAVSEARHPRLPAGGQASNPRRFGGHAAPLLILLVAAAVCYGFRANVPGGSKRDELFYMVGGMTAVETGQWLLPSYQGQVRLQKPPLHYWLVAASYRLFGVGVWQARLPSILAGVAGVALTYWLGWLLFDAHRVALYGACALLGSNVLMLHARWAMTDAPLMIFVLGAFCGFALALRTGRPWGAWLAWLCAALATMEKGPIGFIIPFGAAAGWMFLGGRQAGLKWSQIFSPVGIFIFLALVLPWPLLVLKELGGGFAFGAMGGELGEHVRPGVKHIVEGVVYYAAVFVRSIFPWSIAFICYGQRKAWEPRVRLLAVWSIGAAAVFAAMIAMLRARYMVPVMPALALLSGWALAEIQKPDYPRVWMRRLFHAGVDLAFLAASLVGVLFAAAALAMVKTKWAFGVGALTIALGGLLFFAVRRLRRSESQVAWVVAAAVGLGVLSNLIFCSWQDACRRNAGYELAQRRLAAVKPKEVAAIQLRQDALPWAWMGMGASFDDIGAAGDRAAADWYDTRSYRYLFMDSQDLARMPSRVRERLAEVERVQNIGECPHLLWFILGKENTLARWLAEERTVVLLRTMRPATPVPVPHLVLRSPPHGGLLRRVERGQIPGARHGLEYPLG